MTSKQEPSNRVPSDEVIPFIDNWIFVQCSMASKNVTPSRPLKSKRAESGASRDEPSLTGSRSHKRRRQDHGLTSDDDDPQSQLQAARRKSRQATSSDKKSNLYPAPSQKQPSQSYTQLKSKGSQSQPSQGQKSSQSRSSQGLGKDTDKVKIRTIICLMSR